MVRASRLKQLGAMLVERDRFILERLRQHGFLSTKQIERFAFTGHASAASAARSTRRVLERMAHDRLIQALPRRQGGVLAGSAPATWQLAPAGARLVRDDGDRYRPRVPSLHHLRHTLALADTHLDLLHLAKAHDLSASVAVEHEATRRFTGIGGAARLLRPDLAIALGGRDVEGDYVDHWFIEVDCGTESIPTLLRKCQIYADYQASGIEQQRLGTFPAVLWLMIGPTSERAATRAGELRRRLARAARLNSIKFVIATAEDLPAGLGYPTADAANGGRS
ncbi:replication-relaxation family protein [Pseudactinotalea sp. HY158]|uniref:replication-relaxation family protein n=1 Tax=Pseudactinotalea sp. HY158 TaxID=2654547 RepID=UPI00129CDBB1|nr:replication-relaxation family protein [Pseudactinotalea sp. HY158]QGH68684.1 hypothetical protein GCE65_03605 [Pseudactinotalea sp. HY158]